MTYSRAAYAGVHPNWLDRLLFVALMSGPPKFRERDPVASLTGAVDWVVMIHVAVWACGAIWTVSRLYPPLLKRGVLPAINPTQIVAALFIAALTLSITESPGVLLTAFTVGQFAVTLAFTWVFTARYGSSSCLRTLFMGIAVLVTATLVAAYVAPELVGDETRMRGDYIGETGIIAVLGLVLCLSNLPALSWPTFWVTLSVFGFLLGASRTRSAYIAFLGFLVIGVIWGKGLRVRRLVLPLAVLVFGIFLLDALASTTDYLVRERASVETMSDRIPLWQHLTSTVMREAPLTGLGYYASSRVVATQYNPGLGNAHSSFFEVLVGGGLLGAALYLVLCGSLVSFAVRLGRVGNGRPEAIAAIGLLCVTLLMGIATSAALNAGPLGFSFWLLTALLPALLRESTHATTIRDRLLYAQTLPKGISDPAAPARSRARVPVVRVP